MKKLVQLTKGFFCILMVTSLLACASSQSSRSTGTYLDDKVISTKVKTELAAEPTTKATQIQVETYNGVVQLSGFVDSMESKNKAGDITRNVQGVKEVVNNLIVR